MPLGRRQHIVLGLIALLTLMISNDARAQLGGFKIPGVPLPGMGQAAGSSNTPIANVTVATISFLDGGQKLSQAAGNAKLAARYGLVRDKIQKNGVDKDNLQAVTELGDETSRIADDKAVLDKAEPGLLADSAVKIGVATVFESRAIESSRHIAAGGGAAVAALAAPGAANNVVLLTTVVPGNLKSMLAVQTALFAYLKAKGRSPDADVNRAVASLDKA